MAFETPPIAPQRGDRTTFSPRVDAFLSWLVRFANQMNAFLSSLTTLAGGGANAFAYTFDTATTDSDPGNGKVRFGSATQNTANVIRIDTLAANGGDVTAFMTALQAGTSNVKASLRLQKVSDPATYLLFDITAVTAATGYLNLTVTPRVSTATSPFAANDTLILFFDPKGDKGDGGGTPTAQQIRDAIGTLGIPNGGTGATTAGAALANLGGVAQSGGVMSGALRFTNGTGVFGTDSNGASHQLMKMDADNNVNCVLGPTGWNFYNAAGNLIMLRIDNSGTLSPAGSVLIKNSVPILMLDSNGNPRTFVFTGTDNWLNFVGAATGTRWLNAAQSAVNMVLSDTGVVTATSFTSTSDERKKTNWRRLTDAQLDALADLEDVGLFDWIDGSGTSLGGRAQQIQKIVPEVVNADDDGMLSVEYGALAFVIAQSALRRAREAA